jgi:hypothetical protein
LPKSKSFRILAIWVGVNLLFLILQFLKLEILLLICTSFGGAYRQTLSVNVKSYKLGKPMCFF